jgi:hypothetical protein
MTTCVRQRRRALALVLALALGGCKARDGGPPCYPVRGTVLYRGQPAANADVFFHPVGAADARAPRPHAKADARGEFRLTTRRLNDGAPEGEYVVTVFWAAAEGVEEPPDRLGGRYANPKTSSLRVRVRPGDNALDPFRLE